jgi:ERI1 exoribonuclease 2
MKIQFIDTEMLCWPDGSCPHGQSNHIIQLGLVEVGTEQLSIAKKKSYFVRPQYKDFDVSSYCTALTGITRSKLISEGHYFPEVMRSIQKEFAPQNKVTYAWGSDFNPIAKYCVEYDCPNPWAETGILDFGIIFRSAYNHKHKMTLTDALSSMGLSFDGKAHDALNDALALALLHNKMMADLRNVVRTNEKTGL